jgi:thiol:disulfide interchange protein DsbD
VVGPLAPNNPLKRTSHFAVTDRHCTDDQIPPSCCHAFPRAFVAALVLVIGWLSPTAWAQSHVKVSLVAADASVQPGKSITVALRMVHDAHWHTYWVNPGTGLPTTLDWKLPAGWKASDIQWPAPQVLKDKSGAVIGNGYEGDLLLPVTLTAPADAAPGSSVELKASASWLMCAERACPAMPP